MNIMYIPQRKIPGTSSHHILEDTTTRGSTNSCYTSQSHRHLKQYHTPTILKKYQHT